MSREDYSISAIPVVGGPDVDLVAPTLEGMISDAQALMSESELLPEVTRCLRECIELMTEQARLAS